MKARIEELSKEFKDLKTDEGVSLSKEEALEDEIRTQRNIVNELTESIQELNSKNTKVQELINFKQEKEVELKSVIQDFTTRMDAIQEKIKDDENKIKRANEELKKSNKELDDIRQEISAINIMITESKKREIQTSDMENNPCKCNIF